MIVFENKNDDVQCAYDYDDKFQFYYVIASAAAFHYKKFETYTAAQEWFLDQDQDLKSGDNSIIQFAENARDPYQFISKVLSLHKEGRTISPLQIPITQDASASAYQIISYFLLDIELAKNTNLIPADNDAELKIQDVYIFFLKEITYYFKNKLPSHLVDIVYFTFTSTF